MRDEAQSVQGEASKPGKLVVITGPSGVGKSTVLREALRRTGAEYSVSATTRPPRAGEAGGRDYEFVDRATFQGMIDRGELLEWAEVFGELYGTPVKCVRRAVRAGRTIVLDIDSQGGIQVHRKMPQAVFVLIVPPSQEELRRRLRERRTESEQSFQERLAAANREIETARRSGAYQYTVVNDDLESAVRQVVEIITQECCQR